MSRRLTSLERDMLDILRHAENALTDYIERIERQNPMTSLNYGRAIVTSARGLIAKVEARK